MEITKIVITGGPCAGKSTAMSWIHNEFADKGYTVLFVSETATELITGGISPTTCRTRLDFQKCQMSLQAEKEKVYTRGATVMGSDKVLIVCDRGLVDSRAYMSEEDYRKVLEYIGTNEVEARDSYHAVFHLTTAAKGAVEFYTTSNNSARTETPEEAAALDDKLIAAWTGHPHFRVIDNSGSFEEKMQRLISEISSFLGEPEPYETERKFLIEYPDVEWLESMDTCRKVEIKQTYLKSAEGDEVRVRRRGYDGHYVYFLTSKRTVSGIKRIETERRLSEDEYNRLLETADESKNPIYKTRYCLLYENQYFEIDLYPFWEDKAIVELELSDENAPIFFPDEIKVIEEVTDNPEYKNSSLASKK